MGLLFKNKNKTANASSKKEATGFSKLEDIKLRAYTNCFIEFINIFPSYVVLNQVNDERAEFYKKRTLQLLTEVPDLVHIVDVDGKNIVDKMIAQKNTMYFLTLLNESQAKGGAGIRDLCYCKYNEKEPACFAFLHAANFSEIKIMNTIIKNLGINPVNANGQKWSVLYRDRVDEIENNALRNQKIFNANKAPFVDSLKAVNQEEKR